MSVNFDSYTSLTSNNLAELDKQQWRGLFVILANEIAKKEACSRPADYFQVGVT